MHDPVQRAHEVLVHVVGRAAGDRWNRVAPRDHTSDASVAVDPEATSGARYAGEPVTRPVCVNVASASARAIPKSVSFTSPAGFTSMLDGFTSRWTMPALWAAASASAAWRISGPASSGGQCAVPLDEGTQRDALDVLHDEPGLVAVLDQVVDRDDVGVVEPGGQAGLAPARSRSGELAPGISPIRLSATSRPSSVSRPSQTAPMPPRPISRPISYLSAINVALPATPEPTQA